MYAYTWAGIAVKYPRGFGGKGRGNMVGVCSVGVGEAVGFGSLAYKL